MGGPRAPPGPLLRCAYDVTLVSDDHRDSLIREVQAQPCNECEEPCGGLIVDANENIASNTPPQQEQTHCNCTRKIGPCPLEGDCRKEKSCIYTCKVTRQDTMESETYTGLTAGTFKGRYYGHNRSFNIREAKQTTLSRHCWNLKDKKIPFDRKWTILTHAKPYNPVTKVCRLCMKEVFYILYKPETASLNKKNEVFGWCKHRQHWTLQNS